MEQITTSKQFTLNWRDVGKGLIMAVIGAVLTTIQQALTTTPVVFDWKAIGLVALGTAVAYLLKNFFTTSQTVIKNTPKS